jgi:DNA gyrase/topoisomerase IV subunit B
MHILIWIGKDYLEQLNKNINSPLIEDVFENAVEYTSVAVVADQIQVSIKYDKYIELTDKGLLIEWAGINPEL